MATEPTTLTQPHDCGRSIAGIVREIDELKAKLDSIDMAVERAERHGYDIDPADLRSIIGGA